MTVALTGVATRSPVGKAALLSYAIWAVASGFLVSASPSTIPSSDGVDGFSDDSSLNSPSSDSARQHYSTPRLWANPSSDQQRNQYEDGQISLLASALDSKEHQVSSESIPSYSSNAISGHRRVLREARMSISQWPGSAHAVFGLPTAAPDQCPPCFDCHLAIYPCINFGTCSDVTGRCDCSTGFGLNNCSQPLCGSLDSPNRQIRPPDQSQCTCDPGWTGINCNICKSDQACDRLVPGNQNGTCYNSMQPVQKNHILCDVTNQAIVETLKGKAPQLSLSCDKGSSTCEFQFWAAQCKCYPGHILCEQNGLDFTEWFNNAEEGPNGPGTFECDETITDTNVHRTCTFSEPHMNEVISQFFGDPYIKLQCPIAGECMHYTQVPGYTRPEFNSSFSPVVIVLMLVGGFGLVIVVVSSLLWLQRKADDHHGGYLLVDSDDSSHRDHSEAMMLDHIPCTIQFRNLSYVIETSRLVSTIPVNNLDDPQDRPSNSPAARGHPLQQATRLSQSTPQDSPSSQSEISPETTPDMLESDEVGLDDHSNAELFSNGIGLKRNGAGGKRKQKMVVLEGVQGVVHPGQVMAIMGGSGAGKTTFLDILARKNKSGTVSGDILVNSRFMDNQNYTSIIGYVDQEDTLMDTLTVYETILYSALLRLPKAMTYESKVKRVEETMLELDILPIANRRIGSSGKRGLSGGEKRRVSIACELVTSPSILFLDEPTSGLDAYNAYNVIESLVLLARNYQRTVIFTIHQPRSNIYALFDQLVLLAKGRVVYSGPAQEAVIDHFSQLGFECPLGYNIADYLVDLTMHVGNSVDRSDGDEGNTTSDEGAFPLQNESIMDDEQVIPVHSFSNGRHRSTLRALQETLFSRRSTAVAEVPLRLTPTTQSNLDTVAGNDNRASANETSLTDLFSRSSLVSDPPSRNRDSTSSRASALSARRDQHRNVVHRDAAVIRPPMGDQLALLIQGYKLSRVGSSIQQEIADIIVQSYPDGVAHILHRNGTRVTSVSLASLPSISDWSLSSIIEWVRQKVSTLFGIPHQTDHSLTQSQRRTRASWWTQFKILSGRTFKNLYRNPDLIHTQYLISVVVALICGFLFWKIDNTLAGFQNRLGVMFFICAVFGFGCLGSMQVFAAERLIFVRERANRYYSPITYFVPKILFDILPLRVIPPLILGLICYHMIGLRPDTILLLRFLLVLVLFNLTAASVCLTISIIFKDVAVASLIATLVMLFEMLFGGLLLNKASIPPAFQWMQRLSFFNYAFEALVVNEVNGLALVEEKLGLKIDVPGSVILQVFGLNALGYWEDVKLLCIMSLVFLGIAFVWLQLFVRERR
ncbi:hypothetical protein BASA83_006849 [Batrachochytrium salamandrivorans]|nr:hypothetical protein BASA83_006849 [Batrachochytrium salamandrivorans]